MTNQSVSEQKAILDLYCINPICNSPKSVKGFENFSFPNHIKKVVYWQKKRTDKVKILGFFGQNYQLIRNEDAFIPMYEYLVGKFGFENLFLENLELQNFESFALNIVLKNYTLTLPKKQVSLFENGNDNKVYLGFLFTNSYNGKTKLSASLSVSYNNNTLFAFKEDLNVFKKHTEIVRPCSEQERTNFEFEIFFKSFVQQIDFVLSNNKINTLIDFEIKETEISTIFNKINASVPRYPKNQNNNVLEYLERLKTDKGMKLNLFDFYVAYNKFLHQNKTLTFNQKYKVDCDILAVIKTFLNQ